MVVAICDDDVLWGKKAKNIVLEYGKSISEEMEVYFFQSDKELLNYTEKPLDVVFMDIVFEENGREKEINGIEIAKEINQRWATCQIVYLTNFLFYATEVYETEHIYFVLKEKFEDKIHDVFEKLRHNAEQKTRKYVFTEIGCNEIVLSAEDIRFFERSKRETRIVTKWGSYLTWEKISDIYDKLPKLDFVRCHNSYIVYLPAIRELQKDEIIMEDGTKIVISRSYRKEVKQAFSRWALTQMI